MGGNCGFSIAPLSPHSSEYVPRMLACVEGMPIESLLAGVPWDWSSTGEFLQRLDRQLALNSAWLIGHSVLRGCVMGPDASSIATPEQLCEMETLLEAGLDAGALGFSSTWAQTHNDHNGNPVPSRCAPVEELLALSTADRTPCGDDHRFHRYVGRISATKTL